MAIQQKKDFFKEKLLRGLINSYKLKKSIKGPRIPVLSGKGKTVIKNCGGKCQVCGVIFGEDPHGFVIHHVNGDRTNNDLTNLVLICGTHHTSIHGEVNVHFRDYVKSHPIIPRPKPKKMTSSLGIQSMDVLQKMRTAEMKALDTWKKAVEDSLKNLGYI